MARLFVFLTASPRAAQWRTLIVQAAQERSWLVIEDDGAVDPAALDQASGILVLSSLAAPSRLSALGFVVVILRDTSAAAMAMAADETRHARINANYVGAALFAAAADLGLAGAVVLDASASSLAIPLLGDLACGPAARYPPDPWGALSIYSDLPPSLGATARWPLQAFVFPSKNDPAVDTEQPLIDLTGRARTLAFGPYTTLSTGLWRVQARVMMDPESGAAHLRFEWGSNPEFSPFDAVVSSSGVYGISIDRYWPASAPAEFRITTTQAHFHGRFELLSVNVTLVGDRPPPSNQGSD